MESFEDTKSEIVSSGLGQALALTLATTWAQIITKIKAVVNRGAWEGTISTSGGSVTVPKGYHDGSGKVTGPTLAALIGTGVNLASAANLLKDVTAYGKNGVKYTGTHVCKTLAELVGTNVTLASAANLLKDVTAYGKNGVKYTGSMPNNGAVTVSITTSGGSYTIPKGYHNGSGKVTGPTLSPITDRGNKKVAYAFDADQSISFSIPANTTALCMVFCDYYSSATKAGLRHTLSSGSITYADLANLQITATGGHGYTCRLYRIQTSGSAGTLTLNCYGAITAKLMY